MNKKVKTYYRLKLPHIHPVGATFFMTFRLADALPISMIREFKEKLLIEKVKIKSDSTWEYKQKYLEIQKEYLENMIKN